MTVWIDADALPKPARERLLKFGSKRKISMVFVSNSWLPLPASSLFKLIQVSAGADVADQKIIELMQEGDLVITADVPLAHEAVTAKKGHALSPFGRVFDENSIGEQLAVRDLHTQLRSEGQQTKGAAPYGDRQLQNFTNALDRLLTKLS